MTTPEITEKSPKIHERDAATLAFDIVRQFITIAISGIAFVVGLSVTTSISAWFFWSILFLFVMSVVCGLIYLMHCVRRISHCDYNINDSSVRLLAIWQIGFTAGGILLLCFTFC